ncbi:Acetyltransferase (GNAT) domain-containing protein [Aliiroseovarius halocynthiae]|uniref:GNAT family N-acetyltransferase n=1 Tax=Aliiroseovarius halocynthiae TaxID=985055 RepID=A0A545SNR5_9RHOB|nr:GNAT family N-acetyltransferase [Aliiroseovarius halocynthiae]TQV66619.1 GNAT family N-acetyltransferase [Aliiroseovarius halocynthiae]SMR82507.1 Acetyltransferase (GNAT) domain-containing protein [Aliiroseovarius halocynthiae]
MKSLEFATDLMVQDGQTEIQRFDDRFVQRTPDEPNYWFGNRVVFNEQPKSADDLIAQFHTDLPEAKHICISWDVPNLSIQSVRDVFESTGLRVEQGDVLALRQDLMRVDVPEGITVRPLVSASDWRQSEAIGRLDLLNDGAPEAGLDTFLMNKTIARQDQIAKGLGQWFGAFDGDTLAGDMGIFNDDRLIRYQSVQTHAAYRRRGICSSLLCICLDWAKSRAPDALPVIVANADTDAGRLYRRAGFTLAETTVAAYRPPK